jgi:hypothetical protein
VKTIPLPNKPRCTRRIVIFDPGSYKDIDTGGGGEYKYQMSEN